MTISNSKLAGKVFLALIASTLLSVAQDKAPAEPKYTNSFYALDLNGKMIELERQPGAKFHNKVTVLPGYYSGRMLAELKPGNSPVSLPANATFIVRGRTDVDPTTRYELRALKVSKDHREVAVATASGSVFSGGSSSVNPSDGIVPIRFEEYGENSYRIIPTGILPPGEYVFVQRGYILAGTTDLYCFGVIGLESKNKKTKKQK